MCLPRAAAPRLAMPRPAKPLCRTRERMRCEKLCLAMPCHAEPCPALPCPLPRTLSDARCVDLATPSQTKLFRALPYLDSLVIALPS